jgi:long-chain acyl-CoA synthetase
VYYSESVNNILANFREIKPHILVTVPLLLEKVYEGILKKGHELKGIKRLIFDWALNLAKQYELHREFGWWYTWQLNVANKLVFSKWREALGGNMIKIICGGASVQVHLLHIFWAARIPVYEGYGLTEAAPLVSYNTEDGIKAGTIGRVIHDVLVKISDEGEILVKGPNVMKGYFKHPEWTAEAIDAQGWLHTGDLGTIDDEEFLKITGRKKDIFKINSGIYVYPEVLESKLKQSFFITQALVIGENRNYLVALIQPNFDYLKEWCLSHHLKFDNNKLMVENEKVIKLFEHEIKKINGLGIKENETIQKFALLPDEWLIDTGELTPSLKMKRKHLTQRYADIINRLYV